jgi:hypothetical protein
MKKFALVSFLALAAVAVTFATPATSQSSLAIGGKISTILSVNATAGSQIVLDPAGATDVVAGTVNFKSNRANWSVSFSSGSGGYLVNPANKQIAYGFILVGKLRGEAADATTWGVYSTSGWTTQTATATKKTTDTTTGDTFTAKIKYLEEDNLGNWQDDTVYTDTVTITVTAA